MKTAYGKRSQKPCKHTVDGRNPAPVDMENLPLFIYRVLSISGGAGFLPSTVFFEERAM